MAKKKVNKSQAIREHLKAHPNQKPAEAAAALTKRGVKVTPQYVSVVKSSDNKKSGGKSQTGAGKAATGRRGRPPKSKPTSAQQDVSVRSIVAAKQLVEQAGSVEKAYAAIEAYSEITG